MSQAREELEAGLAAVDAAARRRVMPHLGYPKRISRDMVKLQKAVEAVTHKEHPGETVSVLIGRGATVDVIYKGGAVAHLDATAYTPELFHPVILTDVWRSLTTPHGVSS